MRDLAIIIRCHGIIPINFYYGCKVEDVLNNSIVFDHSDLIKTIYMITIAKMAGVCYGSPNISKYVDGINKLKAKLYEEENIKNTEELVNYLYGPKPKIEQIRELNSEIFNISFNPEITRLGNYSLDKIYTGDINIKNLGVFYLSSNEFTGNEINEMKSNLVNISNHLNGGPNHIVKKSDIIRDLSRFNIDRLYLIDLTCFAYDNLNRNTPPLTEEAVNWLNTIIESNNLKGGGIKKTRLLKNKKTKRKKTKTRKCRHNTRK
jgi:hypothetical protein